MSKRRKKQKLADQDAIDVDCPKCGHVHHFESLEAMDDLPSTTPCEKCGFEHLNALHSPLKHEDQ